MISFAGYCFCLRSFLLRFGVCMCVFLKFACSYGSQSRIVAISRSRRLSTASRRRRLRWLGSSLPGTPAPSPPPPRRLPPAGCLRGLLQRPTEVLCRGDNTLNMTVMTPAILRGTFSDDIRFSNVVVMCTMRMRATHMRSGQHVHGDRARLAHVRALPHVAVATLAINGTWRSSPAWLARRV